MVRPLWEQTASSSNNHTPNYTGPSSPTPGRVSTKGLWSSVPHAGQKAKE